MEELEKKQSLHEEQQLDKLDTSRSSLTSTTATSTAAEIPQGCRSHPSGLMGSPERLSARDVIVERQTENLTCTLTSATTVIPTTEELTECHALKECTPEQIDVQHISSHCSQESPSKLIVLHFFLPTN